MQYPAKTLYRPAVLLLLLAAFACRGKRDNIVPPRPDPVRNIYLVTAIRVNNVPKDSLVYNDQYQVTQRWDYNTTYRKWQNYIVYTYKPDGYVATATYYNEIEYNVKSLTQRDSLVWGSNNLTTYTINYRELGNAIASYDTTILAINEQHPSIAGTKDTLLNSLGGPLVKYISYTYQKNDLTGFMEMSYIAIANTASLIKNKFDLQFTSFSNPLYPQLSKNPHLLRTILGERFPDTADDYYPYLVSEHLVAGFQYETEKIPPSSVVNTMKWQDSTFAPQTQILTGAINKSIGFTYKIITP